MPPLTIFACSACPGDYEDPDRTAEEPDYLPEWEGDDAESAVEGPDQFASGPVNREVPRSDTKLVEPTNEHRDS